LTTLSDDLRNDFLQARTDLLAARRDQQVKDCLAHRTAIAEQVAHLDGVLDLYLSLFPRAAGQTVDDTEDRPGPVAEAA
jgi:hypothetical protein